MSKAKAGKKTYLMEGDTLRDCRLLVVVMLAVTASYSNAESNDPRLRDEDISAVKTTVQIEKQADGNFRYIYTVTNDTRSKGTIGSMLFDVNCPNMPNVGERRIDSAGMTRDADYSADGRHVPFTSELVGFRKRSAGFSRHNEFGIMLMIPRGDSRSFILISPNKPGNLPFYLDDSTGNEKFYDYWDDSGQFRFEDGEVPWYEDWEVHGVIKGPTCTENVATPLTRPIFDGQRMPEESREINGLLRFEVKPNRNRWHEPITTTSTKFRIYYDYAIDATRFSVTLNGRDVTLLFHPSEKLGSYEEVTLPLDGWRTVIEFKGCKSAAACDVDPFEVRRVELTDVP